MNKIKENVKALLELFGLLTVVRAILLKRNVAKRDKLYKDLVNFYLNFEPFEFNKNYQLKLDKEQIDRSVNRYKSHANLFFHSVILPIRSEAHSGEDVRNKIVEFYGENLGADILAVLNVLEVDLYAYEISSKTHSNSLSQLISTLGKTLTLQEKRSQVVKIFIQVLVDDGRVPKFYEIDYLQNLEGVIKGLYPTNSGTLNQLSANLLTAISYLVFSAPYRPDCNFLGAFTELGVLGEEFKPLVLDRANPYVSQIVPEKYDTFGQMFSTTQRSELLGFNAEYSARQFTKQGQWDCRDVSLLRGYEQDHHLLLRTIISLIKQGKISTNDRVLVVGPRHVDEIHFFRSILGLKNTIGLDLFDVNNYIIAGDMHEMAFDSNTFKLVYSAGTIAYSYDVRKVFAEMIRVLQRPGYIMITDAMNRTLGVDPLGRSDVVDCEVAMGMFHDFNYHVIARDEGISLDFSTHLSQPSFCLEIQ